MISPTAEAKLRRYLQELSESHVSLSSVTDPEQGWRVHVLDSLTALDVREVADSTQVADIGTGGGFPGVALAAAVPSMHVDLVESVGRKCEFMREALTASGIDNAAVINERAESLGESIGRERYEVVCARALGSLATVTELASPLLKLGGLLLAWKGSPDDEELDEFDRAAPHTGMKLESVRRVDPFPGSRNRTLYLVRKTGLTPANIPRRPGMAAKRPLGS